MPLVTPMTRMSRGRVLLIIVTGMSATTIVAMAHRHTQPMHARGRMACQNDLKMRHSARM